MSDYEEIYNSLFKDIVENPDGSLNKHAVMRELFDYSVFMQTASTVYCHITGNRVSKINTKPEAIIAEYEERLQEAINIAIEDEKEVWRANCTCGAFNAPICKYYLFRRNTETNGNPLTLCGIYDSYKTAMEQAAYLELKPDEYFIDPPSYLNK